MEQRAFDHEARLSRIEGLLQGLNQRIDDAVITQLKDHGKRIRDLETHMSEISETCAVERGRSAGSRSAMAAMIALISSIGGLVGAVVGKFF